MKKLNLIICLSIIGTVFSACGGGSGSSGSSEPSKFEGVWIDTNIKEYRDNKSKDFICENTSNTEWTDHKNEFDLDLMVINNRGEVRDTTTAGDESVEATWKVNNDGLVSDSYILKNNDNDSEDSLQTIGQSMEWIDKNTIANVFKLKEVKTGEVFDSKIEFVRTTREELAEIDAIVQTCNVKK